MKTSSDTTAEGAVLVTAGQTAAHEAVVDVTLPHPVQPEASITNGCGTHGGGWQKCANDPSRSCYDCGYQPCVDVNGMCWSCWGADHRCYPYACSSGMHCGMGPCVGMPGNESVVAGFNPDWKTSSDTTAEGAVLVTAGQTAAHEAVVDVTPPHPVQPEVSIANGCGT